MAQGKGEELIAWTVPSQCTKLHSFQQEFCGLPRWQEQKVQKQKKKKQQEENKWQKRKTVPLTVRNCFLKNYFTSSQKRISILGEAAVTTESP